MDSAIICQVQHSLSWIEIIQAIGTAIALPAAVWGVFKLFKKDREKQIKIESLVKAAYELSNQTDVLRGQLEKMEEGNKLWADYIQTLSKLITTNQKASEFQIREFEQNEKIRNLEAMPIIISAGTISGPKNGEIRFKNIGGVATIEEYIILDNHNVTVLHLDKLKGTEIDSKRFSMYWQLKGQNTRETSQLHLQLTLKDRLENLYQVFISGPINKPEYSDPIEISNQ